MAAFSNKRGEFCFSLSNYICSLNNECGEGINMVATAVRGLGRAAQYAGKSHLQQKTLQTVWGGCREETGNEEPQG